MVVKPAVQLAIQLRIISSLSLIAHYGEFITAPLKKRGFIKD
jgi:hypothetical protein